MDFTTAASMDDRVFIEVALDSMVEGDTAVNLPISIVADWVARNWPLSYYSDPQTIALIEKWEWHLGSLGTSIPDWLSDHEGLPTLIAAASRGLEIVRTDNLVSILVDKHEEAVHALTGVGPKGVREAFEVSLEFHLVNRKFSEVANTACVVFHGFDTALVAEINQGNESYDLLSSMHLNRAYLKRLVKHSIKAELNQKP